MNFLRPAFRFGFTLIELMIVVAIIAVLAAIAIPGLLRSRVGSNEAATIGSLKSIATGQDCFRLGAAVDLNKDGQGEYGYLEELAGSRNCRSDNAGATAGISVALSPFIPSILGRVNANGETSKSGYLIVLYLPSAANAGVKIYPSAVDVALSAHNYAGFAFPEQAGRTGVNVFLIDPQGNLLRWPNSSGTFGGAGNAPPWNASRGDTDGTAGVTWDDGPDNGGPGQTGTGLAWTVAGG